MPYVSILSILFENNTRFYHIFFPYKFSGLLQTKSLLKHIENTVTVLVYEQKTISTYVYVYIFTNLLKI